MTIADIQIGPAIKTFWSIQLEYGLDSKDHYPYIQIVHLLNSFTETSTAILWQMFLYFSNPNTSIKGISLFYNFLHQKTIFTKTPYMRTWEIDLKISYNLTSGSMPLHLFIKLLRVLTCGNYNKKNLLRWYLTPTRLAGFNPKNIPTLLETMWSKGLHDTYIWNLSTSANFQVGDF